MSHSIAMKGPAEVAHGPMFIGFTINVILYGIMLTQVYLYYTMYKKDRAWMKFFVFVLLVADTANTVFDFIYLYRSLILNFANIDYLAKADWLFATDPAITGIIASLVQFFFAWRVQVLTHSWLLSAAVCMGSLAGGISGVITAFEVIRTPEFVRFLDFKAVVITWLASESVTDVLITVILVWYLRKHKTGFQKSDLMVDRIIRLTVQTGFITSLIATLDLIFFLTDPTGTHLIFNFPLCKLYTNSLMSSLNSRGGWQYGSSKNKFASVVSANEMNISAFSASGFPPSPPRSPVGPTAGGFTLRELCNSPTSMCGSPPHSPKRGALPGLPQISKPMMSATYSHKNHPEVFVRVESHEARDSVFISQNGRKSSHGLYRDTNGQVSPTKQRLSVCLSIDTDTTDPSPTEAVLPADTMASCKAFDDRRFAVEDVELGSV